MEENDNLEIIKQKNQVQNVSYDTQLRDFENGLQNFLTNHNLPTKRIFVGITLAKCYFKK
ncbi:MAG: hypothetical protein GDA37_06195 [Ekhidna sp.]|nr:hypothetical protein [Ekhidna sp.]